MLGVLTIEPRETHDASIIWMHGLGATADDFVDMPRSIQRPATRWVFPQAPHRKVTLNHGFRMPSWFDIRYLSGGEDSGDRESRQETAESAASIAELIEAEHDRGIPYERIVLIGFSQGGALALYTGCRFPHRLAGIACLSGYLLFHETHIEDTHAANRSTPLLIQHGSYDETVPFMAGKRSAEFLEENGWPVDFDSYPMAHQVCMAETDRVGAFIAGLLDES